MLLLRINRSSPSCQNQENYDLREITLWINNTLSLSQSTYNSTTPCMSYDSPVNLTCMSSRKFESSLFFDQINTAYIFILPPQKFVRRTLLYMRYSEKLQTLFLFCTKGALHFNLHVTSANNFPKCSNFHGLITSTWVTLVFVTNGKYQGCTIFRKISKCNYFDLHFNWNMICEGGNGDFDMIIIFNFHWKTFKYLLCDFCRDLSWTKMFVWSLFGSGEFAPRVLGTLFFTVLGHWRLQL